MISIKAVLLTAAVDASPNKSNLRLTWIKASEVENPEMVPLAVILRRNFEIGDLR
ncbi:hypothetical protein [Mesorhizobium captivum]|uniref:Uncharacterized protein n=1 Tax=Mesorhizobium captivum TaxID=3072319 RepID=A0ABU4Z947_9HYPH|nr:MULTISPECIES: hypothetical protein [unclassified Mesorhizobium]MDX8444010.1 hypothetical protein [Mesorhizobium sp. VK3C]MDX8495777.1 hypothetical protein [Mesorhizobium sp. VK22B]